jgi:hypothetical protein
MPVDRAPRGILEAFRRAMFSCFRRIKSIAYVGMICEAVRIGNRMDLS